MEPTRQPTVKQQKGNMFEYLESPPAIRSSPSPEGRTSANHSVFGAFGAYSYYSCFSERPLRVFAKKQLPKEWCERMLEHMALLPVFVGLLPACPWESVQFRALFLC